MTKPITWYQRHSSRDGRPLLVWRASTDHAQAEVRVDSDLSFHYRAAEYGPWGGDDGFGHGPNVVERGFATPQAAISAADYTLRCLHHGVKAKYGA